MAFNNDTHLEEKFLQIRDKYQITSVIETGTYYADTTKWLSKNFEKVYTCEVNAEAYAIAKKELEGYDNVHHELKASQQFLGEALEMAEGNILVFLDAHWYENPLLKEIEIIGASGKSVILAIHDFKVPGKPFGYDVYPSITYEWKAIEQAVNAAYTSGYTKEYNQIAEGAKRGCIFIYPQSTQDGTGTVSASSSPSGS